MNWIILIQSNLDLPCFLGERNHARYIHVHGKSRELKIGSKIGNMVSKSYFMHFETVQYKMSLLQDQAASQKERVR